MHGRWQLLLVVFSGCGFVGTTLRFLFVFSNNLIRNIPGSAIGAKCLGIYVLKLCIFEVEEGIGPHVE
jgi:hypothetical protein